MGKRRQGREMAVQMLYQAELGGGSSEQLFAAFDLRDFVQEVRGRSGEPTPDETRAFSYAQHLVHGTLEHRDRIDELIRHQAENWRLERMPVIDRNILRLAIYELLYEEEVPKVVAVDEAIELAKKFGAEKSGRFVNGLLDAVLKSSTSGEAR